MLPFYGGYRFYDIRAQWSGNTTFRRKLRQPPDGVGKHYPVISTGQYGGSISEPPFYSGCPGELPTSADSCQHCRTLSENRTAIAVYRGVAKRDTLSVELTRQPQT